MKAEAFIFDMDGVIIDSEPFWREAEIEIFQSIGVSMTDEMCRQMKGIKVDDVVKHWHSIYKWQNPDIKTVELRLIQRVQELVMTKGEPMDGLIDLLDFLKAKNIKIGLATSSTYALLNTVMESLGISHYFDALHSAESEKAGKPEPYVYQGAAKKLGIQAENCVAIEDSFAGLQSAKAAKMYAVALPENGEYDLEIFNIADKKVKNLSEIKELNFFL